MSKQEASNQTTIPPEMTPAVKAFVSEVFAEFEARINELEAQLQNLTPQNSSVPPSTQHPHARPNSKPKTGKKKRKQGGQKGYSKHSRELIAAEECNEVIPCIPDHCRRCGDVLAGSDAEPIRHQVWDLPPIKPVVTEYQQHRLHCPCCGITTCGALPPGVPTGQCGPRLAAFLGLLMGHFRQSKRRDVSGRPVERSLLSRLDGHDSDDRECFAGGYVRATASGTVEAETTVRR